MADEPRLSDLVDSQQIADRLHVERRTVNNWRAKAIGFPEPVLRRQRLLMWSWPQVREWAVRTGRLKG
jgi:hypothetical protein